jgi:hypothetical protein
MKRIRMMGLCLVAAIAVSVAGVSAASAAEFTTKTGWPGGTPPPVVIHSVLGSGYLEATSGLGSRISCTGGVADGEVTGAKTIENNKTTFKGCTTVISGTTYPCENPPYTGGGEIKTKVLKGTLGEVENTKNNTTDPLPAIRFEEQGGGGVTAEFGCAFGGEVIEVKGTIIGSTVGSGINVQTNIIPSAPVANTFAQTLGIQKYAKFVTTDNYETGGCPLVGLCTGVGREWQTPNPQSPILCKSLQPTVGFTPGCLAGGTIDKLPYPATNKQGTTCLTTPAYGCVMLSGESMIAKQVSVPPGNLGVTK